ncbi:ATP-binding protein [Pseudomonas sp. NC26]|uniref:ATP-binding protein n=1 Tax=Pseudomonas sp. NC26 TaxID=3114535 RepID=UPI002DF005E4|nr:ATP-binding protein [Pseudomonas sp. NC26]
MIIFVAGVYGSGKTTICSRLAADLGYLSVSASELIRARRGGATWNSSKKTKDIERNQSILIEAVAELKTQYRDIILDGHFALIDSESKITILPKNVFSKLKIDKIILIESDIHEIKLRLKTRDKTEWNQPLLKELMGAERNNALAYHEETGIPLKIFNNKNYQAIVSYLTKEQ